MMLNNDNNQQKPITLESLIEDLNNEQSVQPVNQAEEHKDTAKVEEKPAVIETKKDDLNPKSKKLFSFFRKDKTKEKQTPTELETLLSNDKAPKTRIVKEKGDNTNTPLTYTEKVKQTNRRRLAYLVAGILGLLLGIGITLAQFNVGFSDLGGTESSIKECVYCITDTKDLNLLNVAKESLPRVAFTHKEEPTVTLEPTNQNTRLFTLEPTNSMCSKDNFWILEFKVFNNTDIAQVIKEIIIDMNKEVYVMSVVWGNSPQEVNTKTDSIKMVFDSTSTSIVEPNTGQSLIIAIDPVLSGLGNNETIDISPRINTELREDSFGFSFALPKSCSTEKAIATYTEPVSSPVLKGVEEDTPIPDTGVVSSIIAPVLIFVFGLYIWFIPEGGLYTWIKRSK